jgi:subtilisin-like proprotein convertase family protein
MKVARRLPSFELLEDRRVPAGFIAVGTDAGLVATVKLFADRDHNGTYETTTAVMQPFGSFTGGVRVALGDFDGDGNDELVTALGTGGLPRVVVWHLNSDGSPGAALDSFLAFAPGFRGGVFVAAGDLDNDGRDELVVSTDTGSGFVKVFSDTDHDGILSDNLTDQFLPFGGFRGGVRVALGNTNNTGGEELIVAAGPGTAPIVKVYTDSNANRAVSDNPVLEAFLAYPASYHGGVYVASGMIQSAGSNGAEIIVAPGKNRIPQVKIFTDSNSDGAVSNNPLFDSYLAYPASFTGGVRVAAGDTDDSGSLVEVVTIPGPGRAPHLVIRDDTGDPGALLSDNPPTQDLLTGTGGNGAFVAFGKVRSETFADTDFPQTIADLSTLNTSIFVPASSGIIADLDVDLSIFHSFDGDLDVTLTHVSTGTSVSLFNDVGGTNEGFFIRLNDDAGTDISGASNPKLDGAINGTFNPGGTALLSAFNGQDASGEWRLSITDDTGGDTGILFGWTLHFSF